MTIQGPPGNNSNHPEPIRGNDNASRAHQVPFTTPLPVDHLLGKLFKYLTRCGRGARAVRILPPWAMAAHGVLGLGHAFQGKLYFTKDMGDARSVHKGTPPPFCANRCWHHAKQL